MSVIAVLSGQPTLGGQFGILVGVTSVLTLTIYAICALSLFRLSKTPGARILAVLGLLFAAAAVAAAAPGYILPTVGFFALTTAAWFAFMRKSGSRVDQGGAGA